MKTTLKDLLYGCESFNEFAAKVRSETIIRKETCSKHGLVDHSYCKLSNASLCLECLKTRRFKDGKKRNMGVKLV